MFDAGDIVICVKPREESPVSVGDRAEVIKGRSDHSSNCMDVRFLDGAYAGLTRRWFIWRFELENDGSELHPLSLSSLFG